jgi:predicted acylesterase/phospholipase RssA
MPPAVLQDKDLDVKRDLVGISYSGGGPLLLIELGIAQAFVELAIVPIAIAGVSAGAMAAVAHGLDPVDGKGVTLAAKALATVNNGTLNLNLDQIVLHAIWELKHLAGLGDNNDAVRAILGDVLLDMTGSKQLPATYFDGSNNLPTVSLGATDRISGNAYWFSGDDDVTDALVASSAIPFVFPAKPMTAGGKERVFVDGGVVSNQPLSELALKGCGTIYACAVGYDGEQLKAPTNLVDNGMQSISIMIHESSRLEQAFVQTRMGDAGVIHHIHPEVAFPISGFNFSPTSVAQVMEAAKSATMTWIRDNHLRPEERGFVS